MRHVKVHLSKRPGHGYNAQRLLIAGMNVAGYGLGLVPRGKSARQETGGPEIAGPWAYAWPLAAVIDNHGGTASDIERDESDGVLIRADLGDALEIEGETYEIIRLDRDNVDLRKV